MRNRQPLVRYELLFVPAPAMAPDRAAFERYFVRRDNYTVKKGRASYANEDTGVDFAFEYGADTSGSPPAGARPWARFTLDYLRPSLFAEEATRELEPFASHFGNVVIDSVHTAPTVYTTPLFLKNWDTGNREACGPYPGNRESVARFVLPRSTLLATWQWNYRRKALQREEGDGLFVPKVLFIHVNHGVATSVIWPDAMPIRAPKVDYVMFSRERLAPRGLVGHRSDVTVTPWREISQLVTGDAYYDSPLVSWRVTDPRILTGLARRVAGLTSASQMPPLLSPDKVLDREGFAHELS